MSSSSSLIDLSRQRIILMLSDLSIKAELIHDATEVKLAEKEADRITSEAWQTQLMEYDHGLKQLAVYGVMLDKARNLTQEDPDMNDEKIIFWDDLLLWHTNENRVWSNESSECASYIDEYLYDLIVSIQCHELRLQERSEEYAPWFDHMLDLWRRAKNLYPENTAIVTNI